MNEKHVNRCRANRSQLIPYLIQRSLLGTVPAELRRPSRLYTNMCLEREEKLHACQQLQFTDDGVYLYRSMKNTVQVLDTRTSSVALKLKCSERWHLKKFMLPVDSTKVILSFEDIKRAYNGHFELWDVRQPNRCVKKVACPIESKFWNFSLYNKKENIFFGRGIEKKNFISFNWESSSYEDLFELFPDRTNWTTSVKDASLSSDCSILVMRDVNYFVIIRDLCFKTFLEDLQYFKPLAHLKTRLNLSLSSLHYYDETDTHLFREDVDDSVLRACTRSRNRPEILYIENFPQPEMTCGSNIYISHNKEYFIGPGVARKNQLFAIYSLSEKHQSADAPWPSIRSISGARFGTTTERQFCTPTAISPDGSVVVAYDEQTERTNFYSVADTEPQYYRSQQQHKELAIMHSIKSIVVDHYAFSPITNALVTATITGHMTWHYPRM